MRSLVSSKNSANVCSEVGSSKEDLVHFCRQSQPTLSSVYHANSREDQEIKWMSNTNSLSLTAKSHRQQQLFCQIGDIIFQVSNFETYTDDMTVGEGIAIAKKDR